MGAAVSAVVFIATLAGTAAGILLVIASIGLMGWWAVPFLILLAWLMRRAWRLCKSAFAEWQQDAIANSTIYIPHEDEYTRPLAQSNHFTMEDLYLYPDEEPF